MHVPLSFAEFFAGIGLVGEGLAKDGWKCIYANDLSPLKRELYVQRNGHSPHYILGDVWDAKSYDGLGRVDLATASFPCTDLSEAGRGLGFGGTKS